MLKYVLLFIIFSPALINSQTIDSLIQGTSLYEDITKICKMSKDSNQTWLIEIENHEHKLKGPRGEYSIVKANKTENFLNVYCITERYNSLLILTSRKIEGRWEQYAGYQVWIPDFDFNSTLVNIEFPDIHTAYLLYKNKNNELDSYVIRLVESGYAVYKFLNNLYIYDDFQLSLRRNGRPKF